MLARCLRSAAGVADEIMVVDTGSTDRTKEIARREGGRKSLTIPGADDFAAARNYSFDQATMDYQLWLDADDVLPENTRRGLMLVKEQLPPWVDVVMLPYHTAFDEAGRPLLTCYRERLLRRSCRYNGKGRCMR